MSSNLRQRIRRRAEELVAAQDATRFKSYDAWLRAARKWVPAATLEQIKLDVPRTFAVLPRELQPESQHTQSAENSLENVLLAAEWKHCNVNSVGAAATYTQGMNLLAGICIACAHSTGGYKQDEGMAFWLLDLLLVSVLGLEFYAEWPPLLAFHAASECAGDLFCAHLPLLARTLGDEFRILVTTLTCKLFITCFVGYLPTEPLLALWAELLQPSPGFAKRLLFVWFVGLLQHLEPELLAVLECNGHDATQVPSVLSTVQRLAQNLPPYWRPVDRSCPQAKALEKALRRAQQQYLDQAYQRQLSCSMEVGMLEKLHSELKTITDLDASNGVDKEMLHKILAKTAPSQLEDDKIAFLFELLDRDGSGHLDFFELMTGILVLSKGGREKKLKLIFDLFDTSQDGFLDSLELLCLAKAIVKMSGDKDSWSTRSYESDAGENPMKYKMQTSDPQLARIVSPQLCLEHVWASRAEQLDAENCRNHLLLLDSDGDGRVSWHEFQAGAHANRFLAQSLSRAGVGIGKRAPSARSVRFRLDLVEVGSFESEAGTAFEENQIVNNFWHSLRSISQDSQERMCTISQEGTRLRNCFRRCLQCGFLGNGLQSRRIDATSGDLLENLQ